MLKSMNEATTVYQKGVMNTRLKLEVDGRPDVENHVAKFEHQELSLNRELFTKNCLPRSMQCSLDGVEVSSYELFIQRELFTKMNDQALSLEESEPYKELPSVVKHCSVEMS